MKFKIIFLSISVIFSSCRIYNNSITGNFNYTKECLGTDNDGSEIIQAWINSNSFKNAGELACKDILKDVIFKGIEEGNSSCYKKPIIEILNGNVLYETYFNEFFSDNRKWSDFAKIEDGKIHSIMNARRGKTYGIKVKIYRSKLKNKLEKDGLTLKN
jgi:hypothetical protein